MPSLTPTENKPTTNIKQQQQRVCFSFAAYAKSVTSRLRSLNIPIAAGLSDAELTAIETAYRFNFPPDLRAILREGLPVGPAFPNWRSSSSSHHLHILLSFPIAGILNDISKDAFPVWPHSFGARPIGVKDRLARARTILEKAPALVPIFRDFYIPSYPLLNGNPVLFVKGGSLRCAALDLADFFERFTTGGLVEGEEERDAVVMRPAWAAKTARRVEVWSELVDDDVEGGGGRDTWRRETELGGRLREGGWKEEDVREMMDGEDGAADRMVLRDRNSVMWHVRLLALALLRGGWSTEDVVDCMGSPAEDGERMKKVTWRVDSVLNEISMEFL